MTDKRSVTIGVTINLGNYESLRLEVSDTAETKSDADELRSFLSDVLDGFGNNNATTKSAIEKYKEKILADGNFEKSDEPMPEINPEFTFDLPTEEPAKEAEPVYQNDFEMEISESRPPLLDEILKTEPEPEKEPIKEEPPLFTEIETAPVPEPEPPKVSVPISKPSEGEYTCEKCGEKISKVQRDVSNLFMGKSLCKNCMK